MTEHRNITDRVEKPKQQVSMISTKEPLYKKEYHAAPQLYPKITGGGGWAQLSTPQTGCGGWSYPHKMLSDDNADRNSTINSGNGLSVGGGGPETLAGGRGSRHHQPGRYKHPLKH